MAILKPDITYNWNGLKINEYLLIKTLSLEKRSVLTIRFLSITNFSERFLTRNKIAGEPAKTA